MKSVGDHLYLLMKVKYIPFVSQKFIYFLIEKSECLV